MSLCKRVGGGRCVRSGGTTGGRAGGRATVGRRTEERRPEGKRMKERGRRMLERRERGRQAWVRMGTRLWRVTVRRLEIGRWRPAAGFPAQGDLQMLPPAWAERVGGVRSRRMVQG